MSSMHDNIEIQGIEGAVRLTADQGADLSLTGANPSVPRIVTVTGLDDLLPDG